MSGFTERRNVGTSILTSGRNLNIDFTDEKFKKDRVGVIGDKGHIALKRHQGSHLDNLRISYNDHKNQLYRCLNLRSREWSQFDFYLWFRLANDMQVICLDVDIEACLLVYNPESLRYGPDLYYGSLFHRIIGLKSWDRLTTVSLKSVIMFDDDLHLLLRKSPNLETLLLNNVPFAKLEVKDTNLKLKRVEVVHCAMLKNIRIISAPNLESLKYIPVMDRRTLMKSEYNFMINTNISLQIENAPRLEDMYLGGPFCPNIVLEVQKHAPQLKKLKLDIDCYCQHRGCYRPTSSAFPTLRNLKQLELSFTTTQRKDTDKHKLRTISPIVNSCPRLEKLTLEYHIEIVDMADEDCSYDDNNCHPNECLKEVKIVGWSGLNSEIELVHHLIRASTKLHSLTLDPTPPQMSGYFAIFPVKRTEREHRRAALVAQLIGCLHKELLSSRSSIFLTRQVQKIQQWLRYPISTQDIQNDQFLVTNILKM